jgi:hypothetical protein
MGRPLLPPSFCHFARARAREGAKQQAPQPAAPLRRYLLVVKVCWAPYTVPTEFTATTR